VRPTPAHSEQKQICHQIKFPLFGPDDDPSNWVRNRRTCTEDWLRDQKHVNDI